MASLITAFSTVGRFVATSGNEGIPFQFADKVNKHCNKDLATQFSRGAALIDQLVPNDLPFYILNIPFVPDAAVESAASKWDNLTRVIREQSFGTTTEQSVERVQQCVFAIIGMNRPVSIDREDNQRFVAWTRGLCVDHLGFPCRVITTQWEPAIDLHSDEQVQGIDCETAQIAFLVLEYLDTQLADTAKRELQGMAEQFRKQIPFIHIREWIKEDMQQLPNFRRFVSKRLTYLSIMDDDPVAFRCDREGLFSEYDGIIYEDREHPPQLMSTGYFAPTNTKLITQLALVIDMKIRQAANRAMPGAIYFPEPNMCLLLSDKGVRNNLSFLNGTGDGLDTEGRRLIVHLRDSGHLRSSRICFVAKKCLLTTIPERMEATGNIDELSMQNVGRKQTLKSLRGISQTHAMSTILSSNIFMALKKRNCNLRVFTSYVSKLFQCFDPIALCQTVRANKGNYSYKNLDFMLQIYPVWLENFANALNNHDIDCANIFGKKAKRIADRIWGKDSHTVEDFTNFFKTYTETAQKTLTEVTAKVGQKDALRVFEVTRRVGKAIFKTLHRSVKL